MFGETITFCVSDYRVQIFLLSNRELLMYYLQRFQFNDMKFNNNLLPYKTFDLQLINYTYYLGKFVLGSILNNIFFTDKNRNTENESGSNEFEL